MHNTKELFHLREHTQGHKIRIICVAIIFNSESEKSLKLVNRFTSKEKVHFSEFLLQIISNYSFFFLELIGSMGMQERTH